MEDERNINFSDEETSENPLETEAEKVLEAEETPEPEEAVLNSEEAASEPDGDEAHRAETVCLPPCGKTAEVA